MSSISSGSVEGAWVRSGVIFFLAEGNGEEQLWRGHLLLLRGLPLVAVGPHHRSKMADLEWQCPCNNS